MSGPIVTIPFSKVNDYDVSVVGAKGANLGKLLSLRAPVPNGFVVTTYAFDQHVLANQLREFVSKELSLIDPSDSVRLENAANRVSRGILKFGMSKELEKAIGKAYSGLSGFSDSYVAVRSSAPFEDLKGDSFSGQFSTYLNVRGKEDVIEKIRYCWASLYTPKNVFYAMSKGYDVSTLKMSVVVQKMVQAEVSGMLFTVNPIDNDPTKISIEAVLGLGEALSNGQLTPDNYIINKETGDILEKHIVPQEWMLVRKGRTKKGEEPNMKVNVSEVWKSRQKLENKYIEKLVKVGNVLEEKFGRPQDVEWTYEGGKIWIVQSRPITTLRVGQDDQWKTTPTVEALKSKIGVPESKPQIKKTKVAKKKKKQTIGEIRNDGTRLLVGKSLYGGVVSGAVASVNNASEITEKHRGSILVVQDLTADFLTKLSGIVGVVTNAIPRDPQIAVVSKNLGIPLLVGTQIATKVLKDGEVITINGVSGEVVAGAVPQGLQHAAALKQRTEIPQNVPTSTSDIQIQKDTVVAPDPNVRKGVKTATKVYTIVSDPDVAQHSAAYDVEGAAVVHSESLIRRLGVHPSAVLRSKGETQEYIQKFATMLYRIGRVFEPRPVIYKLNSMSSKEFNMLERGAEIEAQEENPLLGMKGANRILANPDEVGLELQALKALRNKESIRNINIAMPFVRTYKEVREMKHLISAAGFRRSSSFNLYLVIETPSSIIDVEKMLDIELDGILVNTDALMQHLLAIDVTNPRLQGEYELDDRAVMTTIERLVKVSNKKKVECLVYGDLLEKKVGIMDDLVQIGVRGVAVLQESLEPTMEALSVAERKLITRKKR